MPASGPTTRTSTPRSSSAYGTSPTRCTSTTPAQPADRDETTVPYSSASGCDRLPATEVHSASQHEGMGARQDPRPQVSGNKLKGTFPTGSDQESSLDGAQPGQRPRSKWPTPLPGHRWRVRALPRPGARAHRTMDKPPTRRQAISAVRASRGARKKSSPLFHGKATSHILQGKVNGLDSKTPQGLRLRSRSGKRPRRTRWRRCPFRASATEGRQAATRSNPVR